MPDTTDNRPPAAGGTTDPAGDADPAGDPAPTADPVTGAGPVPDPGTGRTSDPGWREPAWFPPRDRHRERRSGPIGIVIGLAFVAFGVYEFLDRTLGVHLPRIPWSSLWPIVLIVIGGLILVRSFERRR